MPDSSKRSNMLQPSEPSNDADANKGPGVPTPVSPHAPSPSSSGSTPGASPTVPRTSGELVRQSELLISNILRIGVIVSAVVILIGVVDYYAQYLGKATNFSASDFPRTLGQVGAGLGQGNPLAIIALGLLLLLATPVLRVAVSILAFAAERDRDYVIITLIVLAILLGSILIVGNLLGNGPQPPEPTPDLRFFIWVFAAAIAAGLVGSLIGLGGGIFIVPLLTLVFHYPIDMAIGASIVSVIATSSGAAAAYVRDRITNLRVGMFLEIATTFGAVCGAFLVIVLNPQFLFIIFGFVLLISAVPLIVKIGEELPAGVVNDRYATSLRLAASYPDQRLDREVTYQVTRVPVGFGLMYIAGLISGLLGIGSGTFKVLAMDTAMRLPMKVSTTTSNFMIGVTAAASAGIYFHRGDIDPLVAAPVALGVLIGATLGAKTLARLSNTAVRKVFVPVLVIIAGEMLLRGFHILP